MTAPSPADLAADYRDSRRIAARHGKTFYLATALLPPAKRPAIHALYGFARFADDIVDDPGTVEAARAELGALRCEVEVALAGGWSGLPVVRAMADTVHRHGITHSYITDFLQAMATDLTVTGYPAYDDLVEYMWGSASVIGLQVLPVLGLRPGRVDVELAERCAADLGIAFQLTNFIRDVAEDLGRGRIYLPQADLDEHGVLPEMLAASRSCPEVKALIRAQVSRARSYYSAAAPGIALLAPDARDCVQTAFELYGGILDVIAARDFEVLIGRASVPRRRRIVAGASGYLRAVRARTAPRADRRPPTLPAS
jgi:phytoene synthase